MHWFIEIDRRLIEWGIWLRSELATNQTTASFVEATFAINTLFAVYGSIQKRIELIFDARMRKIVGGAVWSERWGLDKVEPTVRETYLKRNTPETFVAEFGKKVARVNDFFLVVHSWFSMLALMFLYYALYPAVVSLVMAGTPIYYVAVLVVVCIGTIRSISKRVRTETSILGSYAPARVEAVLEAARSVPESHTPTHPIDPTGH